MKQITLPRDDRYFRGVWRNVGGFVKDNLGIHGWWWQASPVSALDRGCKAGIATMNRIPTDFRLPSRRQKMERLMISEDEALCEPVPGRYPAAMIFLRSSGGLGYGAWAMRSVCTGDSHPEKGALLIEECAANRHDSWGGCGLRSRHAWKSAPQGQRRARLPVSDGARNHADGICCAIQGENPVKGEGRDDRIPRSADRHAKSALASLNPDREWYQFHPDH